MLTGIIQRNDRCKVLFHQVRPMKCFPLCFCSSMIGIGLTMEGTNQNYIVYDLVRLKDVFAIVEILLR